MRNAVCIMWFAIVWLLLAPSATSAATNPPSPVPENAMLVIENRDIMLFRATTLGRTPADRAAAVRFRINRTLDKDGEGVVTTHALDQGIAVEIDAITMFVVLPGDVDDVAGETLELTANRAAFALTQAVAEAKERNDLPRMLKSVGLAVAASLLFSGFVYGLITASRRLIVWLSTFHRTRVRDFKIGGVVAINPNQFLQLLRRIVIVIGWIIALAVLQIWLSYVLSLFPYTRPWGEELSGFLFNLALSMLDGIARALPGLVTVVFILFIARVISGLIIGFFDRVKQQHIRIGWLDEHTALPTQRIAVFIIWLFALAMSYPYLPAAQTDAFKGLSVLVGLMLSIGASGIVGQLASGMILLYAGALRKGDYVKIGDLTEGTVTELGLTTTHIQTGTGEEVIIPNAVIVASVTRNFSREVSNGRAFALQVGVTIGYSTPWRQVHAMLLESATRTKGIIPDPPPYVIQTALSDFYIEYKLVAYAGPEAPTLRALALSSLYANVLDVFNQHGVQIMSPHYMADPSHPVVVTDDPWASTPAQKPDAG